MKQTLNDFRYYTKQNGGFILSDGTLNLQHLLAKAYDFIQHYQIEGKDELLDEIWNLYTFENDIQDEKCDLFRFQFVSWANLKDDEESQMTASYIWNEDIYNLFNEISPVGFYFGSSESDGACIGWFEVCECSNCGLVSDDLDSDGLCENCRDDYNQE
jgi:hypothetical protein